MLARDIHGKALPRISKEKEALAPGHLDSSKERGLATNRVTTTRRKRLVWEPVLPKGISSHEMIVGIRYWISPTRSPIRFPSLRSIPRHPAPRLARYPRGGTQDNPGENGPKIPHRERHEKIDPGHTCWLPSKAAFLRERACLSARDPACHGSRKMASMFPRKTPSACRSGENQPAETTFFTDRRKRRPEDLGSPRATKSVPACGRTAITNRHGPRTELASRDLSHVRVRAANCQGLPEQMEPILSWVFTSLGCSPLLPWPHPSCSLLSRT
jgi:hypothetical protein